jgi:hypothetical protein
MRLRDTEADAGDRELLDANLAQAMEAYRSAPDFETAARALSGWREALVQRMDATREGEVEIEHVLALHDGTPIPGATMRVKVSAAEYWRDVPRKYRDRDRFAVHRVTNLSFTDEGSEELKVYERATDALVWVKEAR